MSQKDFTVRPWKLLSSTMALDEKWFPVRKDTVQLPSGKIIDDYFVWEGPHIVATVALTTDNKFVMVRQYRHAIQEIKIQFPAGARDKGETSEEAARRELREESGYEADAFIHLGTFAQYATKLAGLEDTYLALNARKIADVEYDEQEESEVILMSEEDIWQLLEQKETHMMNLTTGFLMALRHLKKM